MLYKLKRRGQFRSKFFRTTKMKLKAAFITSGWKRYNQIAYQSQPSGRDGVVVFMIDGYEKVTRSCCGITRHIKSASLISKRVRHQESGIFVELRTSSSHIHSGIHNLLYAIYGMPSTTRSVWQNSFGNTAFHRVRRSDLC